jgi:hypothetical protein
MRSEALANLCGEEKTVLLGPISPGSRLARRGVVQGDPATSKPTYLASIRVIPNRNNASPDFHWTESRWLTILNLHER